MNNQTEIPDRLLTQILLLAKKDNIDKLTLFGSRARGTQCERSDIDLAVSAQNEQLFDKFVEHLESLDTLLIFDVVYQNGIFYSHDLDDEIKKDGMILYEKI